MKKEEIKDKIEAVLERHSYIFENREDFNEDRTSWADLAEIAEDFYYTLYHLKNEIENLK